MTKIEMKLRRETKGTYLFEASGGERIIDAVYVRKSFFEKEPKSITLFIDSDEKHS